VLAITVVFFAALLGARGWSRDERSRLVTILVLFVAAAVFGRCSSRPARRSTCSRSGARTRGCSASSSGEWFQSANPIFIVLLAPAFAWCGSGSDGAIRRVRQVCGWSRIRRGGFGVLIVAARIAETGVKVSRSGSSPPTFSTRSASSVSARSA
jgi:POT family proton-dependent oligopeptide transporter